MDFKKWNINQRFLKPNFNNRLFIKGFVCSLFVISSSVSASESYKVLSNIDGLLSSQNQLSGEKLRGFSSRNGVSVFGDTTQDKVNSFLKTYGGDFSSVAKPDNFKLSNNIKTDHVGFVSAKYQQSFSGIKVTGSYMNLSLKGNQVRSVFSSLIIDAPTDLKLSPTLSKDNAVVIARNVSAKQLLSDINSAKASEPVLELFNWSVLGNTSKSNQTVLTWYIELTGKGIREQIWIDAHSGKLINRINNLHSAKNREVYDSQDTNVFQNILVRSENDGPTNDVDTDAAFDFSGDTYDYFFDNHSLDSIDGQGATLISNVHYCESFCPMENAFWDGIQMTYGEGFAVDDVVAHELTHAVIENSADLIYQNQSGALNESYADIFGETVDLINGAGDDSSSQRWFLGEDIPIIGSIRHLSNPGLFGDPETVSDPNFFCGFSDNGGVHTNSGVPNKAYSLMVDGGSFNGFTVNGIGLEKSGKIQYRALSTYLGPSSTFADNYDSLILSCNDLIGSSGITANDCIQVEAALNAVEMNGEVCFVEPPEEIESTGFCPKDTAQSTYFTEGFEVINSNLLTTTALINPNMWDGCQGSPNVYCNNEPNNGSYNLSGRDISQVSDSVVTLSPFVVKSNSFVSFDHKYDFENSYDGAVVEYSLNNGGLWADAMELYSNGLNYSITISSSFNNPLSGRDAFSGRAVGINAGYLRTILDLSSLSGETIQFRFRIGTDSSVSGFDGWRVDDVLGYQCSSGNNFDLLDYLPALINGAAKNRQ